MDRKEAIEIVRKNYPHVGFSGSEFETALRELVPEFKEQPDPRHSLIEFIKWSCDRGCITPEQRKNVDFWIDYLEKQKEHKPAEKISVSEELYEHIRNTCACIDDAMSSDTMCDMTDYLEMANSSAQKAFDMVDKSVVKQPAEWSEEDERKYKVVLELINSWANGTIGGCIIPPNTDRYINWFKSLPERFNLQLKQEWSEEDEKMIDLIIAIFKVNHPNGHFKANKLDDPNISVVYTEEIVAWLKSLRPQPHKWYIKKGHWYMCIVDKPEYGWTKGKVYQSPEDNRIETDYKGDLTNWPYYEPWFRPATMEEIPDSQPNWKPSEEQMEILSRFNDPVLKSLYYDLQKLL